ncbi:MAG: von Willebrand factor type A domain-containing protein, partial [bacterium]
MVTLRSAGGHVTTPDSPSITLSPRAVATSFSPKFKAVAGKELGAGIGTGYGVGGFGAGDRAEAGIQHDISRRCEDEKKPDARTAETIRNLEKTIIPQIEFRQANIHDVVEFLAKAGVEGDSRTLDKVKKSPNIVLNLDKDAEKAGEIADLFEAKKTDEASPAEITFTARYISMLDALKIVTQVAGLKYRIVDGTVMIEPADATEAFAPAAPPPDPGETAASGPEPVYPPQVYNPIIETKASPFSTFGIDVDTASFTLARRYLLGGRLPPTGAIRVEEFVNAFEYAYKPPENATFAVYCDRTRSPFRPSLEVLRIGVRGKVLGRDRQRPLALTFIVDTSGSMNTPDRLELARKAMSMLLDRLTDADSMAIVAFGSEARLVLDHTRAARKDEIRAAIASLQTYGSTHLEGGIWLGYEIAARRFRSGAANRVMIFSDGVANLGAATSDEILKQVETYRKQGVFCSVFGLGVGAYNDAMLQALADKGDGVYRYLDSLAEAKRVLVDESAATLHVIAKDVKIQVEFQPDRVKAYRQIGYEKRHLEKEQFRDDAVDAGEVGSGQSSTALYELETSGAADAPLGIVRLRWKDPETGLVTETAHPIRGSDKPAAFEDAPPRFRLAVGVAELADWMRENPLSTGTEGGDILKVVRTAGMELNLDRQVKDVVRMATAA